MSRKPRTRRMSSRELMAQETANPSPRRAPPPPHVPQTRRAPPVQSTQRQRRSSFAQAAESAKKAAESAKKMWRRKSVMTRSMDQAPPPPSSSSQSQADTTHGASNQDNKCPQHKGFVGSSLTVLDDDETAPQAMRVFLMNNSYYEFDIDATTIAGEICLDMRATLELHNDAACSLFSYSHGNYTLLQDDASVLDEVRTWNVDDAESGATRLVYKARIHIPNGKLLQEAAAATTTSNGAHRLMFIDAVHRTITGLYSIPIESAPLLAALQLQSAIGDYDVSAHGTEYISDTGLENYVAPSLMGRFDSKEDLEDIIRDEHVRLAGTSSFAAECQYMSVIKQHVDYYGSSFFAVRVMVQATDEEEERSEPQPAIVAISFNGIYLLSGWNLSIQDFHSFEVVTKWTVASNPDLFAFSVHDTMIYFLMCEKPNAIEDCVQMHISTIIGQRRGAATPNRRNEQRVLAAKEERYGEAADAEAEAGQRNVVSHRALPPGWSALADSATGKTYYWHEKSGRTMWRHPSSKPPPPTHAPPPRRKAKKVAPPASTANSTANSTAPTNKRRMNKRRKSALKHMAARRRASVSMVMAVSSGIDTTVPEATPAEEEEEVLVAAAVVEEVPEEEEYIIPVQEEEQEEEEEQKQGNEQGKAEEPEKSYEEHIIRVQEEVQEEEEEQEQVPSVVTVESWLSGNRLEKFLDALRELGVENVADLKDVLDEDLESIGMKKLEIRRYLAATESL